MVAAIEEVGEDSLVGSISDLVCELTEDLELVEMVVLVDISAEESVHNLLVSLGIQRSWMLDQPPDSHFLISIL